MIQIDLAFRFVPFFLAIVLLFFHLFVSVCLFDFLDLYWLIAFSSYVIVFSI